MILVDEVSKNQFIKLVCIGCNINRKKNYETKKIEK